MQTAMVHPSHSRVDVRIIDSFYHLQARGYFGIRFGYHVVGRLIDDRQQRENMSKDLQVRRGVRGVWRDSKHQEGLEKASD